MSIAFPRREARPQVRRLPISDTASRSTADLAAIVFLILMTAIVSAVRLHFDFWIGRVDLLTAYVPFYAHLGQELRNFNIPGWSPFQASGLPFAGDPQSGWMYLPSMVFYAFLSPVAATKAMVVFHLGLASLSTYAFARVLGLRPIGSVVAAVSFAFGATVHHTTACCTIWSQLSVWLPLGFLGIELSLRQRTWRGRFFGWSLTGFAVSQMMAGWLGQGVYNAALLLGAWLAYRALISPPAGSPPIRERLTLAVVSGAAILVLGLGLSAAGLLPRLEANQSSILAGGDYAQVGRGSGEGWVAANLVQRLLGTNDTEGIRYYVGGVTAALMILAPFVARRRYGVPFFAGVVVVTLLLVLDGMPLRPLYSWLPRYEDLHHHRPSRIFGLFFLAPAMLAGATVDTIGPWLRRRFSLLVALLPVAAVISAALFVEARYQTSSGNAQQIGRPAVIGMLAVSLILVAAAALYRFGHRRRSDWMQRLLQVVPVLLLLALLWEPTGRQLTEDKLPNRVNTPARQTAIEVNLADTDPGGPGEFIQQQLAQGEPFRYFGYDAANLRTIANDVDVTYQSRRTDPTIYPLLVSGRATRLEVYDIQGYNPAQSALYAEYLVAVNGGVPQDYHDANILTSGFDSPLINLLSVRYIIVPLEVPPSRPDLLRLSQLYPTVFQNDEVRVLENPNVYPHAWITHGVQEAEHTAIPGLISSGQIDPRQVTLVEQGETPALPMEPGSGTSTAVVTRYDGDAMTIETSSTGNGMLVVSEIFSPGWNAYIDGDEAPIQGVNYLFRGIPLPAGEHTVEFRYEPVSLRFGIAMTSITALGIGLVAILPVLPWRRRIRAERSSEIVRPESGAGI